MKEHGPTPIINQSPEAAQAAPRRGELIAATLRLGTANFLYTGLKGYTLGMEVAAAMRGRRRLKEIRWDPTDEDVRGKAPGLDRFRDESRTALFQALHLRRCVRRELSQPAKDR